MNETVVLKCPKCGHFLAEIGNFYRGRHCGYEIIVNSLREDPTVQRLTAPAAKPTLTPTT